MMPEIPRPHSSPIGYSMCFLVPLLFRHDFRAIFNYATQSLGGKVSVSSFTMTTP
jgi:hypothetical protein